jgi:Zn-dependent protease
MRDQKWSPLFVALAGPATNFAIAAAAGAGVAAAGATAFILERPHALILTGILTVNVFLGIINALPVPPLDGSRVLGLFLSSRAQFKLEELGQYMILFLLVLFLFFGGVITRMADPVCRTLSLNTFTGCFLG